jgi:hypothetical protein
MLVRGCFQNYIAGVGKFGLHKAPQPVTFSMQPDRQTRLTSNPFSIWSPRPHLCIFYRHTMENLHAPTVPSGPTSTPLTNGTNTNGLSLAQLQAKKENIEAEIRALSSVLDSVCPVIVSWGLAGSFY